MDAVLDDEAEAVGLAVLSGLAVQEAALFAARAEQLHDSVLLSRRLCGADGPERFLVLDVAGTLRIGQLAAGALLAGAQRLVEVLTGTLGGLRDGRVFVGQAQVVLAQTQGCSEQVAAEVDRRLHAAAPDGLAGWTGRRLHDRLRRLVLQVEAELDPAATEQRERTARAGRRVGVRPEPDGMASLWALLPAEQLRTFTLGLDELHRRQLVLDRQHGIERTADQRRADLLVLLPALALHALDGTTPVVAPDGSCTHSALVLNVHMPLATALGLSQAPGTLEGYGPISAAHARALLPTATLRRIIVDDTTGQPLYTRTTPTIRPARARAAGTPATGGAAGRTGALEGSDVIDGLDGLGGAGAAADHDSIGGDDPVSRDPIGGDDLLGRAAVDGSAGSHESSGVAGEQGRDQVADRAGTDDATDAGRADHADEGEVPAGRGAAVARDPISSLRPEVDELVRNQLRLLLTRQPLTLADLADPDEGQYRPSTPLARFVRLRDPLCTGPGCATHSDRSDLDHGVPWPQGPTAARNLRPLSRRCHRAKTLSWTVTHHSDGSHTWTSPTGRSYPVPPSWDPPPTPRPPDPTPPPLEEDTDTWSWLTLRDGRVQPARQQDDEGLTSGLDSPSTATAASSRTPSSGHLSRPVLTWTPEEPSF